jgi:hypothetical protein
VGETDEAFLTDYPKNILLSEDLELVPWMVGLTTSDGALYTANFPEFNLAGKIKLLHKKCPINFCHLGPEVVTITRGACN